MARKLAEGDIGVSDNTVESRVLSIIAEYMRHGLAPSYNILKGMREAAVFPAQMILLRCCRLPAFTAHRAGSTGAAREATRSIVKAVR